MRKAELALRAVLAAAGAFITVTGIDNAFGGIASLGFQGARDFFAVTDADAFAVRDSNVRFLGGLWLGVGVLFTAGAVWLLALRPALCAAAAFVAVGGLARLTASDMAPVVGGPLTGSLAAELALMPALFLWILASARAARPAQ